MKKKINYCGIKVSSKTLDFYFKNKEGIHQYLQIPNSITGFIKMLKETGTNIQFVMEATGVYHLNLIFCLQEKSIEFSVVNALQN